MATDEKNKDAQKIQESLINTFKKFAEKSIHDANYDKTILATIQYCTDATIGQYKIKYQNGYFTAYSKDLNVKYSNQAAVYVVVPGNNMNNRMFITGLATNNSADRTYITSMEGDQQYEVEGSNYIIGVNGEASLDMSSYWGANKQYKKVLWSATDGSDNYLVVNPKVDALLKEAKSIRIGAEFKTDLEESRKESGDYGLIFTFKYKNKESGEEYYKYFVIDTYHMIGSPFNFTDVYRPQYNIWDLESTHKSEFVGLDKIEAYVESFPAGTGSKLDIFIRNLSLHTAVKLYNTANDTNSVTIQCDQDFEFGNRDSIDLKAILKVAGFEVNPSSSQNVEYYWAKEDLSVNSVNHPKYQKYLGKGWYCLNPSSRTNITSSESVEDLKNYTIAQDDLSIPNENIIWDTTKQQISLSKTLCKGRKTRIKCICYYNNQPISSPIKDVINGEGFYLLLNSADNKVESYNGLGNFTLTAGVFNDEAGASAPISHTLDDEISYVWEETDSTGITKTIPPAMEEFLFSNEEWNKDEDNETKTDEEVDEYLEGRDDLRLCRERYDYYLQKSNYYHDLNPSSQDPENTYLIRCDSRYIGIIADENELIDGQYTEDYNNTMYYIFGPSEVEAIYDSNGDLQISNITPYYHVENPPAGYPTQTNTLYKLPATKIGKRSTYKVTALLTDSQTGVTQSIGTESITLVNSSGAALDYTLEITNGTQTFVYDEGGVRPSVTIQPLFFKLYNLSGDLLYDSEYPESSEVYNLTNLKPRWFFYDSKYSLLLNNYKDSDNCTLHLKSEGVYKLSREGQFYYQLRDQYDVTRKEKSNISLHVTVDGATIIGSTQFTFVKEGEIGTNGTNTALDIDDVAYNGYRNNVLAGYNFATFYDLEGHKHYYQPPQRYVNNTYLYATMCYNGSGIAQPSVKNCNYVNLKFAQGGSDDVPEDFEHGIGLIGGESAVVYGYWYGDGGRQLIDSRTSKWSAILEKGSYKGKDYYLYPSFSIGTEDNKRDHAELHIKYKGENGSVKYTWKPSKIEDVTIGDTHYDYKIANNTVKVQAKQLFGDVERSNFGFYTMPYYYFNYTGTTQMPEGIDPARHIIVVGGFDQVVYDSAGANPTYDKQNPFSFYMINEKGRNITAEVLEGLTTNKTTIEWTCSDAFLPVTGDLPSKEDIDDIPSYAYYTAEERRSLSLFNKYCKHGMNGDKPRIWKCIVNHSTGQKVKIDGKTIDPTQTFIKSYWEEVDIYAEAYQKFNIRPKGMYESIAESDLFNSWVHLYVRYDKSNSKSYEAEVMIPINVLCNKYGSEEINDWDGKSTKVDDSYIISSKVAAGVKNDNNTFTGITLGTNFYTDNKDRKSEIGLFGYGQTDPNDPNSWARTLFLDANTGRMILGPTGSSQIVIDPTIPTGTNQVWSRLAGWYISPDYFYKPIGEETISPSKYAETFTNLAQGAQLRPKIGENVGSIGMYCPWNKTVTKDEIWLWADESKATWQNHRDAKFRVTYGGHLYCTDADISGTITATAGAFGTPTNKLLINHTLEEDDEENNEKVTQHFLLYNKNFWVRDEGGTTSKETAIYIKGKIMAKSGQFGRVNDAADGDSSGIVFINYKWYPWHLPSDSDPWITTGDNPTVYLDKSQGMIEQYILYHKNLYLAKDGSAFFSGKIYAETGRIASWVIKSNRLASYDGAITLSPSGLRVGTFYAEPTGAIGNRGHWWITANGDASFDNADNTFKGKSFVTNNGTGMSDANGLRLGPTDKFYIGQGDATYIEAGNAGFKFNGTAEFTADIEIKDSLTFSQGTGGAMYLNNSGIHMSGSGGSFTISPSGNVELNVIDSKEINTEGNLNVDGAAYITSAAYLNSDLEVGGATYLTNDTFINGTRLVDYIRQIIVGRLTGTTEVITQLGKSYGVNIHSTE